MRSMHCVSSWTGGLQTHEAQLALARMALNLYWSWRQTDLTRSTYLGYSQGAR